MCEKIESDIREDLHEQIKVERKIICDKIRQFIDDHSKYEECMYNYILIVPTIEFHNFIDEIEKSEIKMISIVSSKHNEEHK